MRRVLHTVAVCLSLLVAAIAVMFIMGSGLPREHTVSAAITVHAPQGRLWAIMEDVDAQTRWRTDLKAVEPLPNDLDGHRCWIEVQRARSLPLCERTEDAPITRVVAISDPTLGVGGTWTYNLTALTPDTTSVAILEQGTTDSPIRRFMAHYVLHEGAFLQRYEADLQRAATH